jgi:uncharacterized protein (TIGR02996 family)
MSEHIAETVLGRQFLRDICGHPDDDTPRLIFADWLDEQGHADRAESIRVAIALAQLKGRDRRSPRALELRRRKASLYNGANSSAWAWPIPELCSVSSRFAFARGFVTDLTAGIALFLDNAHILFSIHPITCVRLTGVRGRGDGGDACDALLSRRDQLVTFFNADLTSQGRRSSRLPSSLFAFLDKEHTGVTCHGHGSSVEVFLPRRCGLTGERVLSRAAVAYGRDQAGLPPLRWPPQFSTWDAGGLGDLDLDDDDEEEDEDEEDDEDEDEA